MPCSFKNRGVWAVELAEEAEQAEWGPAGEKEADVSV